MIRYYKLFDLLNRNNMKLSDLRKILSSATVAKLKKGQYISGEAIEKICLFLKCQPGDIMEVYTEDNVIDNFGNDITATIIHELNPEYDNLPVKKVYIQENKYDDPILLSRSDEDI